MFKKITSFSLCVLLCTQSTMLLAHNPHTDNLEGDDTTVSAVSQPTKSWFVSGKDQVIAGAWKTAKGTKDLMTAVYKPIAAEADYLKDELGVAYTQASELLMPIKETVAARIPEGSEIPAALLLASPAGLVVPLLSSYLSAGFVYQSVWVLFAGSIFHQSVVPVLSKESFYEGVSNMKQHMQEKFDDSKQKISAGSSKAVELAMPWFVSGKEYVMAGSEKVAELAAPWCAYGRDKMTAGLKEAHNKARATLLPSAQSVAYNKRFAQIEKPFLSGFPQTVETSQRKHSTKDPLRGTNNKWSQRKNAIKQKALVKKTWQNYRKNTINQSAS